MCRPGLFSRLIFGGAAGTEPNKGHVNPRVGVFADDTFDPLLFLSRQILTVPRRSLTGVGGVVPFRRLPGLQVAGSVSGIGVFEQRDKGFL